MEKSKLRVLLCLFLIFLIFRVLWAAPGTEKQEKSDLLVLASILPLYEFASAVAGERLKVDLWLPPGANPHHWQPRASDMRRLEQAAVLVYVSPSLEPWVVDLLRSVKNQQLRVVSFQDLAFLRDKEEADELDPHIWLDFSLDLQIIDRLVETFSRLRPELAGYFSTNATAYKARLIRLDQEYQKAISSCQHRWLIIDGHAAFGYLARKYGLEQVSLEGINPEAEARPKQLRRVLEIVRENKAKAIFYEAGSLPRLARQLSRETELKLLPLYPGHNIGPQEKAAGKSFIDLMRENLKQIKEGLGCE